MKENNKSLWAGLAVVIATVVTILIVGILALKPQKELITGEADASEYRVSNMVPGHIDTLYVKEGDRVRRGDTLAHIASRQVDAKMLQAGAVLRPLRRERPGQESPAGGPPGSPGGAVLPPMCCGHPGHESPAGAILEGCRGCAAPDAP